MPTVAGRVVLIGGLLVAVSGRLFGPLEFIVTGFVAVIAVVIAVIIRRVRQSQLSISRQLSNSRVEAGQPIRVDLHIKNVGAHATPLLRLNDSISGTRGVRLSLAPISKHRCSCRKPLLITCVPVAGPLSTSSIFMPVAHSKTTLSMVRLKPGLPC